MKSASENQQSRVTALSIGYIFSAVILFLRFRRNGWSGCAKGRMSNETDKLLMCTMHKFKY